MPASETVRVEGLRELNRAFRVADKRLASEMRETLREIAEPVRTDAERLALSGITRVGLPWSQMRVGVTTTSVYIAPKRRGSRSPQRRRPNLAALLLGRAMLPALHDNQQHIIGEFNDMLDTVGRAWERG